MVETKQQEHKYGKKYILSRSEMHKLQFSTLSKINRMVVPDLPSLIYMSITRVPKIKENPYINIDFKLGLESSNLSGLGRTLYSPRAEAKSARPEVAAGFGVQPLVVLCCLLPPLGKS